MSDCQVPENCGDGVLDQGETCDDGNGAAGDGCSPACRVEQGWECSGTPSVCRPICGDGRLVDDEACDDDNDISGDGCDANCRVEDYFSCSGEPSVCVCRVLVDVHAGGPQQDGKTWASAFSGVQDGIDQAASLLQSLSSVRRCQVWVAQGTYEIFQGAWTDSVSLADHVDVLGGFCGTESAFSERPDDVLGSCPTTLDGLDPSDPNNAVDRVVTAGDTGDATLDGFEITGAWNA